MIAGGPLNLSLKKVCPNFLDRHGSLNREIYPKVSESGIKLNLPEVGHELSDFDPTISRAPNTGIN